MQALRRFAREVRIQLRLSHEARIEGDARSLVQKIARENAAVHAHRMAIRDWKNVRQPELDTLQRRVRNAKLLRDLAVLALRRELGLPDDPTQAECADWGEAP